MHGCKICHSARLVAAHSLSCGHRFCQDCLLALLPNSSNPISVLPQHTAIIVCPRCRQRCEYSQVMETGRRKKDEVATGDNRAPSCVYYIDDAERKRRTKRAQFVREYMKENGRLSRKSRSRFEDDGGDNTMRPEPSHFSQTRGSDWRTQSVAGVAASTDLIGGGNEEVVDIRAIDHVNGRFVTCNIIKSSVQDTTQDDCATSKINHQPKLSQASVNPNDFHGENVNSRGSDNFETIKSVPAEFKSGCLFAGSKQRAFLVLLIASLISSPYIKLG